MRTDKEKFFYNYLKDRYKDFISPTEIGGAWNGGHSSTASPVLKRLVKNGLAERNNKGHYKVIL